MAEKKSLVELRDRLVNQSLRDLWWLARNGVTYRTPMSLQSVESTIKKNPQGEYQVCHVRDDGELASSWVSVTVPASRVVESRGNTTFFRAAAPETPRRHEIPASPGNATRSPMPGAAKPLIDLADKVDAMQKTLDQLVEKVDRLLNASELLERVNKQEEYLRNAEETVSKEAHSLENERAELEQLREELERRKFQKESA